MHSDVKFITRQANIVLYYPDDSTATKSLVARKGYKW